MRINNRYGNRLSRKQTQQLKRPPYWRLLSLLRRFRVKVREKDRDTPGYHVQVPDFGLLFRFNKQALAASYSGWDVIDVDLENLEHTEKKFADELMWVLISKGYMAYLRDKETGHSQLFRHFIVSEGWGLRIIERRLELYKEEPRHRFLIERNKRLRDHSISYILTYHPDFFDYLV